MTNHSINPFPGLRPFRQDEDYLFFGREEQTMELLERLGNNRFVAVVGTSGSGKSSLVRCGLLSELQGGKLLRAGASWEIAVTHPGGNPLALLAEALLEADLYDREEEDAAERLLATLSRSHFGLVEAVKQARLPEGTNFLLVVDQFEEIFRFNEAGQTQQEVANEFVSMLLQSVAQTEVPIYVVLTMRSDFIGDCGQFEGLAELVNRGEFLIPRLTREQYKRVIEAPIKVAGGQITPRLLQRLLNDLGQQADQLPCLQHALMRTWTVARQQGKDKPLDLEDYQQVGKMSHALSLHADEVYDSLATDRQRELCATMFQALTVQETENRGIRRPQRLGSLCQILEVPASELIPVIDAYRQHGVTFLMPPPEVELNQQTIIDISHESLMRVWTRLRHWVEEEYQAAGIYRRLSESASLYEQGQAGLYRDPELGIALSWRDSRKPNETWAARYRPGFPSAMEFLRKSQAAAEQADQDRDAARQRELEQAKQLAETQRLRADEQKRSAARLRWLAGGVASVAAIAIVAFALAAIARNQAVENERQAMLAHSQAVKAAQTAEDALEDVRLARDEAQRAGEKEKLARQVAETQTATAVETQKQLQTALGQTETARQDAEKARLRAEMAQQQAEDDRQRAVAAERQAVSDRQLAENNADLARRRERLFEKLLPLLQEHASEGVRQYALKLEHEGNARQALDTFADFCDLVLGQHHAGFHVSDLLDLDSFDLQGLDSEAIGFQISVPPKSLFTQVLTPAIELGEKQLKTEKGDDLLRLVAQLYTYRARLLKQHPNEEWSPSQSAAQLIFSSFDRAAALEPERYEHYLGRAAARFRLPNRDLGAALQDLDTAVRLFPSPPKPPEADESPTETHRQFAQLLDARANVLEYLANVDSTKDAARRQPERLAESQQFHQQAWNLDSRNPQYLIGIARTMRKQTKIAKVPAAADQKTQNFDDAKKLLRDAIAFDAESPVAYNELGEIYLAEARMADAQQAFERAIAHAKQKGRKHSLYIYYCNLANAYMRETTDPAALQKALSAADQAIALKTEKPAEGKYYRGFALWKLGRINDALSAFSEVLKIKPKHVEALLARSQIVFEMKTPNPPTASLLKQAYADVREIVNSGELSADEQAKAYYVNSLGWLRHHVTENSEDAFTKCMDFALRAARGSSAYVAFARQIFEHASGLTWRDRKLQQESERLQQEFKSLIQMAPANEPG